MSVLVRFCQKIEELNNLKLLGTKKAKGPMEDSQHRLRLPIHNEDDILVLIRNALFRNCNLH
jgi:hypothetical protein